MEALQEQSVVQAQAAQQLSASALQNAQQAASAMTAQRDEFNAFILHTTNQIEALAQKAHSVVVASDLIQQPHVDEVEVPIVPIEVEPLSAEEESEISDDVHEAQVEMAEEAANEEQAIEDIEPEPIAEQPATDEEEAEITSDLQQAMESIAEEADVEQPEQTDSADQSSIVPKIDDIKSGISIGDRFLFQRQLFKNNGELMNKTIAKLNTMDSFDEALQYCEKTFNWDKESNAYELFVNVLHRRF